MSEINGIVSLEELPEREIYLELGPEFTSITRRKIKERFSIAEFSKRLDVSERVLSHWFVDGSLLRLDIFKKLIKLFKINLENVSILSLRGKNGGKIKHPKLPFDFTTKEGVRIISAILGDGCLDKKHRLFYTNSNHNLINGFINDMRTVFGDIEFDLRKKSDSKVNIVSLAPVYGKIISKLEMVPGRKVTNNPKIPKFIFKLDKQKVWAFLSQIVDDEGGISLASRHLKIDLALEENYEKSNIIEGIKKLLSKLCISSEIYQYERYASSRGRDRKKWQIEIHGSIQLKKLYSNLDLRHKSRKKGLKTLIDSFQMLQYPKKKCTKIYLSRMRVIEKEKGYFTSEDLFKKMNRSLGHVRNMIHKYHSKGLIQRIQDVISDGTRFYPAKYRVI